MLELSKVLEIEAQGLSISSSAFLLGVHPLQLFGFIKKQGITWRGKRANFKAGEKDASSQVQKANALGICHMTIYKRMTRKGLTFEQAASMPVKKYRKLTTKEIESAIAFREQGKPWKWIAHELGRNASRLSKTVREYQQCQK